MTTKAYASKVVERLKRQGYYSQRNLLKLINMTFTTFKKIQPILKDTRQEWGINGHFITFYKLEEAKKVADEMFAYNEHRNGTIIAKNKNKDDRSKANMPTTGRINLAAVEDKEVRRMILLERIVKQDNLIGKTVTVMDYAHDMVVKTGILTCYNMAGFFIDDKHYSPTEYYIKELEELADTEELFYPEVKGQDNE